MPVNVGPLLPVMVAASTLPCSISGATRPKQMPRCSMHSPTAKMSGSRRLHVVVDDDAAVDLESGPAGRARRSDGCRRRRRRDRRRAACRPTNATPSTRPLPRIFRRAVRQQHADAEDFHLALEVVAAGRVELALHQRVHQVDDRHVAALHLQAARGFEAEQSAADHHRLDAGLRAIEQRARVVQRAEHEDAVLVDARRSAA